MTRTDDDMVAHSGPTNPPPAVRPAPPTTDRRQLNRILASSFLGSMIEFYDFLLYATAAALVFGHVFFADLSGGVAVFASFGTMAAGYLARPLGGVICGHFGDRFGRKRVLVASMLTMGVATALIGLLPGTAQLGALAPCLLIVLRVVQGLAVGGEWGGAMTIALEHAPGGRRGFAASFANFGAPAGSLLATLLVSLVSLLPEDQFLAWGWRIPFIASVVLVALGMFVRLKVAESPLFEQLEQEAESRRLPIVEVITQHHRNLLLGLLAGISMFSVAGIVTVWSVSFAVQNGADKTDVLNAKAVSSMVELVTMVISARLCDRFGRKPVMTVGVLAAIVAVFPILEMVQSGSEVRFALAMVAGMAILGVIFGPIGAFVAELFPTRMRFTGASLCFQGASTLGTGFSPAIAAALVVAGGGGVALLGWVWTAVLAVCLVAILIAPEGGRKALP